MKNKKLQKGIDEIKNIKMTNPEKELVFSNILKSSSQIIKPVKSTWVDFSFMAIFNNSRLVYYIIVPIIIILSSSGVVFASQNSLPDSVFYPIKVNVVEPLIESVLTFSPKNKARYEVNLATKRLVEAETLSGRGRLDKKNEDKINNLLDKHTAALDQTIKNVQKTDINEQSDKIISSFNTEMNTHAQNLDNLKKIKENKKESIDDNKKIDNENKINKNELDQQEIKNAQVVGDNTDSSIQIDSLGVNNIENQISNRARLSAEKINNLSKDRGDNNSFNKESKSKDKNGRGGKGND